MRVALKDRGAVAVEWPCEEEESAGADISSFFGNSSGDGSVAKKQKRKRRTDYFHERRMKHITALSK